jgi:hypothetical protein
VTDHERLNDLAFTGGEDGRILFDENAELGVAPFHVDSTPVTIQQGLAIEATGLMNRVVLGGACNSAWRYTCVRIVSAL